jgi:hypothetical protein
MKQITIEKCLWCPFCLPYNLKETGELRYMCTHNSVDDIDIPDINEIPGDCPLEDKE